MLTTDKPTTTVPLIAVLRLREGQMFWARKTVMESSKIRVEEISRYSEKTLCSAYWQQSNPR
jgi:hypothetical protein